MTDPTPIFEMREAEGDILVATLLRDIFSNESVKTMQEELLDLVDKEARLKIIINFSNVKQASSSALGVLILLHKRLKVRMGKLVLCGMVPEIYNIFGITRLDLLFSISETEEEAVVWQAEKTRF